MDPEIDVVKHCGGGRGTIGVPAGDMWRHAAWEGDGSRGVNETEDATEVRREFSAPLRGVKTIGSPIANAMFSSLGHGIGLSVLGLKVLARPLGQGTTPTSERC